MRLRRFVCAWWLSVCVVSVAGLGCSSSSGSGAAEGGAAPSPSGGSAGKLGAAGAASGGAAAGGQSGQPGVGGSALGGAAPSGSGGSSTNAGASSGGAPAGGAGGRSAATGGSAAGGTSPGGSTSGGNANTGGATAGRAGAGGAATAGAGGGASDDKSIKVWIAGDSTVQNCSSACPCGWGQQFDALFDDKVAVQNSAVGGRSIQTWLYEGNVSSTLGTNGECTLTANTYNARWTAMLDAQSGMKAGDYLFIQFGINDGDTKCPRHVGTARFSELLGVMAKAAKERGAQAVFVTPVSAIECSGSTAVATRGFISTVKDAAKQNDVPVIDLHQLSIDLYNSSHFCPNNEDYSSGALGDFFCEDHTHFEVAGAKQIAALVAKALKTQNIPLASYLK